MGLVSLHNSTIPFCATHVAIGAQCSTPRHWLRIMPIRQHNRTLRLVEGQTHTAPIRIQLELDVDLDAIHVLDELPDRSRPYLVMVWQRPSIIILIGQGHDLERRTM